MSPSSRSTSTTATKPAVKLALTVVPYLLLMCGAIAWLRRDQVIGLIARH